MVPTDPWWSFQSSAAVWGVAAATHSTQLQEKDQKPRPKERVQEVRCKGEWWNYMKLVSNTMCNREIKFSFWVRANQLVPVTGHSSITLTITRLCIFRCTGWRPQESQARTQLTAYFVHLLLPHHCYYIQQRKKILSHLFQDSCGHTEAENQQHSDDKFKQNQFFALYVAQTPMRRKEKVSAYCWCSEAKVPTTKAFGCQMFQNDILNIVMTLNTPHVLSA